MRIAIRKLLLAALLIVLGACGPGMSAPGDPQSQGERLRVVTTISPITNIVYNIGGDHILLNGIVPPGADPHTFEPAPSDAVQLAQADFVFINGLDLDQSSLRLAEANLKEGAEIILLGEQAVDPDVYIYGRSGEGGHEDEGDHDDDDGDGGHEDDDDGDGDHDGDDDDGDHEEDDVGHQYDGSNPHLWTDPIYALKYAEIVRDRLTARDPDNGDAYLANYEEFAARIQALDAAIQATTASIPAANRKLFTYHDSFAYFARRYGYTVLGAVQPSDFSEPSAQEVAALIQQLRAEGVPAIFGSTLFPTSVLDQIGREAGVSFVNTLSDDDLPGDAGDPGHTYIGMMVENLKSMAGALGGDPTLMESVEVGNVPELR